MMEAVKHDTTVVFSHFTFSGTTLSNQIIQSQLLEVGECSDGWIMHELNMLPLITATSVHTHTSTFLHWSENKRCEETGKPSTAQTFHFLFSAHFIVACWNSSQCAQLLGNAKALIAFHQAFQNPLLCKFSPDECRRKGECTLTQTPATWPTCLSVLCRKRKKLQRLLNEPEIQPFFFSSSFAVLRTHFTILHMNAVFICVYCHVNALQL